jgi:hypothetical protein
MWASVALLASLNTAALPVDQVKLTNDRVTHGLLGWERKDQKQPKLYPGDIFVVLFDIEGLQTTDAGVVKYNMGMELIDNKNNKVVFRKEPEGQEATLSLGGGRLAASAQAAVGTDTPVGMYSMKISVADRAAKKSKTVTLSRDFEVVPAELGFTRLIVTFPPEKADQQPLPAPAIGVPGQGYLVNFAPVGFTLDPKKKQPDVAVEMRVVDDKGESVLKEPFKGGATQVDEQFKKIIPMQFILSLNRPGKFKIKLKVTDNLTKKTAEESLDFVVVEAK